MPASCRHEEPSRAYLSSFRDFGGPNPDPPKITPPPPQTPSPEAPTPPPRCKHASSGSDRRHFPGPKPLEAPAQKRPRPRAHARTCKGPQALEPIGEIGISRVWSSPIAGVAWWFQSKPPKGNLKIGILRFLNALEKRQIFLCPFGPASCFKAEVRN